jgi:EmrB/QacA subfamily drug resistance transporter
MAATRASVSLSTAAGRWVLLSTILASSMAFIDGSALSVALPALQADLNATGVELLWIINGYLLMLAALILVGGSLGDHFGRKRVFMTGIAIFTAASFVCGIAPDTTVLILARVVQGIGGALMIPGSLAIITALFRSDERGRAVGWWSTFSTITTIGGPILGGYLASVGLWRFVFFINLPLAAITLFALVRHVPESRNESTARALDIPGALLVMIGLAGLTYGSIETGRIGPAFAFSNPVVIASFIIGALALIGFIIVEARSPHPMVPLRLFRSRTFSGANLMTFFLYAALLAVLFFLPLNLIQVQGYPAEIAGMAFTPFAVLLALLSRWAGGLVDRYGPRIPLTVGPALVGAGFVALSLPGLTGGAADYWTTYFPGIVILGVGMGVTVAPLTTTVMGSVSSSRSGVASGVNNAVTRTAQVLATAILGAVALVSFTTAVDRRTAELELSPESRAALAAEALKFGDARVPDTIPESLVDAVDAAIKLSFIDTFRLLLYIAAGLAFLSAVLAALVVESRLVSSDELPAPGPAG